MYITINVSVNFSNPWEEKIARSPRIGAFHGEDVKAFDEHRQPKNPKYAILISGQMNRQRVSPYLSVHRIQLVGYVPVIFARHSLSDGRLH